MKSIKTENPLVDKSESDKILRSVPFEQGFHFALDLGKYTGETAVNLFSFYEELKTIELQSVRFHFQRRDFQKWVETTLGDQELASRIDRTPSGLTDKELKIELQRIVQGRLIELQTDSYRSSKQSIADVSSGELKKFTVEELKQFNGQAGNPAYFAFEGNVYDVSGSSLWVAGSHMAAHDAGKDLTKAIQAAPHGQEVFSRLKQVGVLT